MSQTLLLPPSQYLEIQSIDKERRSRTIFTSKQKEEMIIVVGKIGGKSESKGRREEDEEVDNFIKRSGVSRKLFNLWMQNNRKSNAPAKSSANSFESRSRHSIKSAKKMEGQQTSASTSFDDANVSNLSNLDQGEKALVSHIKKYITQLSHIRAQKLLTSLLNDNNSNKSKEVVVFLKSQDEMFKNMMEMIEFGDAEGFVYGIITGQGEIVTDASKNLRTWWEDTVQFGNKGPEAIAKYTLDNFTTCSFDEKPGINIREKLYEISDTTLSSLVSALMPHCNPPQKRRPFETGLPPPWWPTTEEPWWAGLGFSDHDQPPYRKPHDMRKTCKVALLTAIIYHLSPNTDKIRAVVWNSRSLQEKMTAKDNTAWLSVLEQIEREYLITPPQPVLPRSSDVTGSSSSSANNNFNDNNNIIRISDAVENWDTNQLQTMIGNEGNYGQFINPQGQISLTHNQSFMSFTCANVGCPRHLVENGFTHESLRNAHQISCPYNLQLYASNQMNAGNLLYHQSGFVNHPSVISDVHNNSMTMSLQGYQQNVNVNESGICYPGIDMTNNIIHDQAGTSDRGFQNLQLPEPDMTLDGMDEWFRQNF